MGEEVDKAGLGSIAVIGPGQVAMIPPYSSHGVWVPSQTLNPTLPSFEVSVIRAAEMFVGPTFDCFLERLTKPSWNTVLPNTKHDLRQLRDFIAFQRLLCRDQNLSREEWLWLSKATWEVWESEGPSWAASP